MSNKTENIYKKALSIGDAILSGGKIGLEKECLRINDSFISKAKHHKELGSSLFNKFITTDFSESLLELITPPSKQKIANFIFLEDIHDFTLSKIGDEFFWPFSMPLKVNTESDITIAEYGNSNPAMLKRLYREGLAIRYGSHMQAIAGLHFNYSLSNSIWDSDLFLQRTKRYQQSKSDIYLGCSRNVQRLNWMILYLYGASPIVPNSLLSNQSKEFMSLDDDYSYLPYATSLRMSDIGYQSHKQSKLFVSYNSLNEYILDLYKATDTFSNDFHKMAETSDKGFKQLSPNFLQIEDEYYATSRPKSSLDSEERTLRKLKTNGIDYLEFRSLDLNPFCRSGIDVQTIYFLELFLLYCCILDSPKITQEESKEIKMNDLIVAKKGREKMLSLYRNKSRVSLVEWAERILDEMLVIAEVMENDDTHYVESIRQAQLRFKSPESTLSAMIIDKTLSGDLSYEEFGIMRGEENKKEFFNYQNQSWRVLEDEVKLSLNKQIAIENKEKKPFEEYLQDYLRIV